MSLKRISQFFNPSSVAVIGASNVSTRAGFVVMRNLLRGGFNGPIMPVTPSHTAVHGVLAYPSIAELPKVPDLAVICTNKNTLLSIIEQLGKLGCKSAIVIADGLSNELKAALKESAHAHNVTLLGPNCLGLLIPHIGLNASFSHTVASPGKLAFVSQSAAVCSTILDWAKNKEIGFSYFVSVGDCLDIDFDELLDFLGRDAKTKAILLYIDNIEDIRGFISAARAAAFSKPVIAIKTGKTSAGALAAEIHTGGKQSSDAVYDALFQRAGMLRVKDLRELFAATQTLAMHPKLLKVEQLTILTNGGGPGVMAVDELILNSGKLTQLSDETRAALNKVIPQSDTTSNPVDIFGDSAPARYKQALDILLRAKEVKNLLIIHTPSALAPSEDYADIIVQTLQTIPKMARPYVITNFMGEDASYAARKVCSNSAIPTYRTPEGAVGAFMHLVSYRRNQKHLTQTPESNTDDAKINKVAAKTLITEFLTDEQSYLPTHQASQVLSHYGVECIQTEVAYTPTEAREQAIELGFPVALKLISPSIASKSEVGGVVLNLNDANEVEQTAFAMLIRIKNTYPDAVIEGFSLQKMAPRAGANELRIAIKTEPNFGPVILLGEAGNGLEYAQAAVALPPLNMNLAKYLIAAAHDKGVLKERILPEKVDKYRLCALLTRISQLVIDQPDISSMELNPILASNGQFLVLDATMTLNKYQAQSNRKRLSIRPYPIELVEVVTLKNNTQATLRPIKPEDEKAHQEFDQSLNKEDRYKRFFGELPQFNHDQLAKMTQIDYDREMAFIVCQRFEGKTRTLGVARVIMDPDNLHAEFATVVRSDYQGLGLGTILMTAAINHCKRQGVETVEGITLPENTGMIELARKLGFKISRDFEEGSINMVLKLN
ncbi:bifunctional acetate--CoA ligase family protein/GNAT family N-acetyltransferase [Pseudoalteromonas carrageenovora]|uniref:bifunctional acetate--CoA ligase family protein/GNAT family N-acetyltransferase n=1 Tax=Pseudoalteromonas carrageenovora TaxID=227 RepID=UPI0026E25BDA|nr:bifunctional acetate--CoA ligase family protein/GNAT family N-acetyltransferase [Pseudoalteromonas carrageenovora]MDO6465587.1 bifunctional acetate--CoA ligase family protein/GNAT family N-acetyltransferase [Pseudoalteromonas carrageenovora]MDO6548062.1 bifunctional acetate--CoA ligase family protein/GNAT family N-acetyltransferase [Pseudoalteromonas carrageenovora]MDO6832500.1 bifunctional acetate--CoA ligase family protein/GNAT family N-acetyltransferase [Pseudoalteromonas carrageenovora]